MVDIVNELDQNHKNMLMKEYGFCVSEKEFILNNAEAT